MRNLIEFIIKYRYWFVFILMEGFSLSMLVRFNSFQGSVFFTTANSLVGDVYSTVDGITSYVGLGDENKRLEAENEALRKEIHEMKSTLAAHQIDTLSFEGFNRSAYRFLGAQVVSSTLHKGNNLITINKGEKDGVKPEMGVVCSQGVVGIVYMTSSRYSIVVPMLNINSRISSHLKESNQFGTMQWEHGDTYHSWLMGIPLHAKVNVGEMVETNGYSDIFPSGIPIGEVVSVEPSSDGLSHALKVKLSTDFHTLRNVSIITNYSHPEKQQLEMLADSLLSEDL